MTIAHWDEVRARDVDTAGLRCRWTNLGNATGSVTVGVRRLELEAGWRPTPPHRHGAEEEIFYVLRGSGLSWQDGATYEIRAGDCLVHRAGAEAHTLRAGEDGLVALAFGERLQTELCILPRTDSGWLGTSWVTAGDGGNPWERDHAVGSLDFPAPSERPATIVNVADIEAVRWGRGTIAAQRRDLGRTAGSIRTGLKHCTVPAGKQATPIHCHSAEEELFLILEGSGELHLYRDPDPIWSVGVDERHPLRAGTVVARPAGTGVAHALHAGPDGLTFLAYGTRVAHDSCYYPQSRKVFLRGLQVAFTVDPVPYWHGEGEAPLA